TTGSGPKVLEYVRQGDVMVLEFIDGPTMSAQALHSKEMATRMADSFRRLHAAPRFLRDFNMFRLIKKYLEIVAAHKVTLPADYRERLPLVREIDRAVGGAALPSMACAHDRLRDNVLVARSDVVR